MAWGNPAPGDGWVTLLKCPEGCHPAEGTALLSEGPTRGSHREVDFSSVRGMPFWPSELRHATLCEAGALPLTVSSTSRDTKRTRPTGLCNSGRPWMWNACQSDTPSSVDSILQPSLLSTRSDFHTFPSCRLACILSHSPGSALHSAGASDRYHGVVALGCGRRENGLHLQGISN